jgi:3-dehydrosphinganine reductase
MRDFAGKKVYITGGSAGIGRALALDLAGRGAHVYVGARGQAGLDETVAACRAAAPSKEQIFGAVRVDVADRESVSAAAPQVLEGLGGLDLLICNAGFAITGYLHELPDEAFDQMIQVNYLGHVHTVRSFLPHFHAQRTGHICLLSSVMGFVSFIGYGAYSASKFAVAGFAQSLRNELMPFGVGVSLYYPTTTDTPGLERENEDKPPETWALEGTSKASTAAEAAADILRHIASGRFEGMRFLDPWWMWVVVRLAPGIARYFVDSDLRKAVAKHEAGKPGLMSPPEG